MILWNGDNLYESGFEAPLGVYEELHRKRKLSNTIQHSTMRIRRWTGRSPFGILLACFGSLICEELDDYATSRLSTDLNIQKNTWAYKIICHVVVCFITNENYFGCNVNTG